MAIVRGDYKILYIKIGGDFKPIGCLTENSFNENTGTIETTTRENTDGWGSVAPTSQGYSIPFSGVNTLDDNEGSIADYDALQNLKRTRSVIEWQVRSGEGGSTESGTGLLTDLSNSAPVGGEVTFSGTITGSGVPISTPQAAGDPPTNFRNSDPATTNCFVEWDKSITGAMQSYRVYQGGVLFREFIGDVDQGTLTGLVPATTYSDMTCRGFDGVEETPDSNTISFATASQTSIVVIDNLLSTSATDALSANQGRILNETKVSSVQEGANVTVDATDPINPIVASIQRPVVDNLTSIETAQSLSANQGKILNDSKLNTIYAGANVTVDKSNPLAPIVSSVPGTSAGTTRRVYFTGDALILSETFYETNGSNQGTVPSVQQQVTNGDNQTTFFAVDFIGAAAVADETLIGGNYTGHLEMEVSSNAGNQRYDIEIYLSDDQGIPFNSGIVNAPIGDLGVEVLAIGSTGVFDVEDDNPTSIVYVFSLDANVDIIAGTRVRYHISATKVGTDGGDVVMSLYSGSDWTAYLDAPASVTTEGVINSDDTITGATQYDVNRSVEASKAGLSNANVFGAYNNILNQTVYGAVRFGDDDDSISSGIQSFYHAGYGAQFIIESIGIIILKGTGGYGTEIEVDGVTCLAANKDILYAPSTTISSIDSGLPYSITTKEWVEEQTSNKIGTEGGEEYRMTGQIVGGETTLGTLPDTRKTTLIRQIGGFLSYQGIETSVGSDTYNYSEGLGEFVLTNNEGIYSVAIGYRSLENNKGLWTTAIGNQSGQNNQGIIGTFVGFNSGIDNTGNNVVFVGGQSGIANTGEYASALGEQAMRDNTGSYNAAVGNSALPKATGSYNTAIGSESGQMPTSTDPMPYNNTTSVGAKSRPEKDNQVMLGDGSIVSVKVGNPSYRAEDNTDLMPKVQTAISTVTGEPSGSTKADNQVVISETDYGDGSSAVTGTLYFIKP